MKTIGRLAFPSLLLCLALTPIPAQEPSRPSIPIGIFLGRIEIGELTVEVGQR